jgi:hypothetical protein
MVVILPVLGIYLLLTVAAFVPKLGDDLGDWDHQVKERLMTECCNGSQE